MTVEELIVFNSTIAPGEGTVLQHLQNIAISRDAFNSIAVDVIDTISADVVYDIITADLKDTQVEHSITEGIEININSDIIGVDV